jgi:hypothetical protein
MLFTRSRAARHGSQRPAVPIQIFPKWNAKKLLPVNSLVPEPNFIELFVRPLHAAGIRYLIAGSVVSMHYSETRLTRDIEGHKNRKTIKAPARDF